MFIIIYDFNQRKCGDSTNFDTSCQRDGWLLLSATQKIEDSMKLLQTSVQAPRGSTELAEAPHQTSEIRLEKSQISVRRLKIVIASQSLSNHIFRIMIRTQCNSGEILKKLVEKQCDSTQILRNEVVTLLCLSNSSKPRQEYEFSEM